MGIIKGIFKYTLILVLILVGVAVVLGAIMIFTGASMFGLKYISYSTTNGTVGYNAVALTNEGSNADFYLGEFDSIAIDAPNMNVTIVNGPADHVDITGKIAVNGFIKESEIGPIILDEELGPQLFKFEKPTVQNGVLNIKVVSANGFLNFSNKSLIIRVPAHLLEFENITANIQGGNFSLLYDKNAKIDVENIVIPQYTPAIPIKCNDTLALNVSGDQNIAGVYLNNIISESTNGYLIINNAYEQGIIGDVLIKNKYGKIAFGTGVNIQGNCYIESEVSNITLNDINNTFTYVGDSCYITIGAVSGSVRIDSPNAILKIKSIIGESGELSVNHGKKVGLTIGEIDASVVNVVTESGDVVIDKFNSNLADITTISGNITIKELYSSVKAITSTGNITITQKTKQAVDPSNFVIDLKTDKGNVVVKDIVSGLKLNASARAIIKLDFDKINADCTINNGDGSLEIALPYEKYVLITSGNANIKAKIGQVDYNKSELMLSYVLISSVEQVINDGSGNYMYTDEDENTVRLNIFKVTTKSGAVTISNAVE